MMLVMRMVMSMVIYKMQKPAHSFHPDNKYTTIFLGSAPRVIVINLVSRRYKKTGSQHLIEKGSSSLLVQY